MRWVAILLVSCVALAALQYVLAALVIGLLLLILWGLIVQPSETFGALAFFLFASMLVDHTAATLTFLGLVGFLLIVREARTATSGSPDQANGASTDNGQQSDDSA